MMDTQKEKRNETPSASPMQTMPHDLDTERAILSAMLREPSSCVDEAVEHLGEASGVFYSHIHRLIFETILSLHHVAAGSADVISVASALAKQGKLEGIGGEAFLAELYGEVPTTANLENWCRIVKGYSVLREMIDVCGRSIAKCYQPDGSVDRLIDEIETDIYKIRHRSMTSRIVEARECIKGEFKTLENLLMNPDAEVGIKTGYPDVDELTGGLKPGEMFVLAARPGIGKTAFALNVIRNLVLDKKKPRSVAFFSLEMTAEQISRRLLCTEAGISETLFWNKSFKPQDLYKLTAAVDAYKDARLFIDPTGGITVAELRAKARRLVATEHVEMIAVDYLQLMTGGTGGPNDSRQAIVAEISGGLKQLAKDLRIPVLVLAQLNREIDKTAGASARPKLSHLRESGAIEQDADIVAFLHRDRDEAKSVAPGASTEAEIIVEKNRNGQTGMAPMRFFPHRMRFETASKYNDSDRPPEAK